MVARDGLEPTAIFGPSEVVPTAIFPIYPATLGPRPSAFSKGPEKGPLLGVAVQEQFRTSPDDKNAAFTGVCRTIGRLGGS